VPWSGRNFGGARLMAAQSIAQNVRSVHGRKTSEKMFLIGHSHGGSAIAYFLKTFPELRDHVSGVAFLSTPFIAMRIRPHWRLFLRALLFSLALALISIAVIGLAMAFYHVWIKYLIPYISDVMFVIALAFGGVVTAYYAWRSLEVALTQFVESRLPEKLRHFSTADIPRGNYLFLRATGDEAAGFLSIGQSLAWLMGVISTAASTVVGYAEELWKWTMRRVWGKFVCIIIAIIFAYWIGMRAFVGILDHGWCYPALKTCGWFDFVKYFTTPTVYGASIPTWLAGIYSTWSLEAWGVFFIPLEFAAVIFWPILLLIVVCALIYSALVLLTVCISALCLMLFGWVGILEALFADFAVEPVPYGQVLLTHVDWNEQLAPSIFGLNHSQTYANPSALKHLSDWVVSTRNSHSADRLRK
jgi:pimeloyl-ACP methyl ester carboxylesterase